jgi:hypothetical protein
VDKPSDRHSRSTSSNRSGWRAAITSSALAPPGIVRTRLNARMTASSSPRIVLPAISTGRPGDIRKNRSTRAAPRPGSGVASSASNFKLPVIVIRVRSAPSATRRPAVSSPCTQKRSTSASTLLKNGLITRYRGNERPEIRPLTTTVLTPRRRHSRSSVGQISFSTMTNSLGRTTASVRRTVNGQSNGK